MSQTTKRDGYQAALTMPAPVVMENSPLDKSERLVATRCGVPNYVNESFRQTMSRSAHFAQNNYIENLSLVYVNWHLYAAIETNTGSATTFKASIEYPAGVFVPVTWGGNPYIIVGSGETTNPSDPVSIKIPQGGMFWVRTKTENGDKIIFSVEAANSLLGEGFEYGTTLDDKTLGGVVVNTLAGIVVPAAIIGLSNSPSVALIGDSRTRGQNDSQTNSYSNDLGHSGRVIGRSFNYVNLGANGETARFAHIQYAKRLTISKYCQYAVISYGINDFNAGRTVGEVVADVNAMIDRLKTVSPKIKAICCTIAPHTTSTDSFATLVNQALFSVQENSNRILYNNSLRTSPKMFCVWDLAQVVESSIDSGFWKSPGYTVDGLHESQLANIVLLNSAILSIGAIR